MTPTNRSGTKAAARDAVVAIDGKDSRSATNTVDSGGLSLTLKGKGKADVTVKQDSSEVARNVGAALRQKPDLG